jgi:dTDP-4-dehydrorhamnose 3,5-epimerase
MQFEPLFLSGAWRITPQPAQDARGSFMRLMDAAAFSEHGIPTHFHQHAVSHNLVRGTLRGMHFQAAPHAEGKLVRCTAGALYDVMVDMRTDSPTYLKHVAATLSANTPTLLYIPAGCAHGFMTLEDNSEIEYHITQPYIEQAQQGLRWDDPKLGIHWPIETQVISPRDANFAYL